MIMFQDFVFATGQGRTAGLANSALVDEALEKGLLSIDPCVADFCVTSHDDTRLTFRYSSACSRLDPVHCRFDVRFAQLREDSGRYLNCFALTDRSPQQLETNAFSDLLGLDKKNTLRVTHTWKFAVPGRESIEWTGSARYSGSIFKEMVRRCCLAGILQVNQ